MFCVFFVTNIDLLPLFCKMNPWTDGIKAISARQNNCHISKFIAESYIQTTPPSHHPHRQPIRKFFFLWERFQLSLFLSSYRFLVKHICLKYYLTPRIRTESVPVRAYTCNSIGQAKTRHIPLHLYTFIFGTVNTNIVETTGDWIKQWTECSKPERTN